MLDPKPAASLMGSLLVRKGEARPAMTPDLVMDNEDGAAQRRVITLPRPQHSPAIIEVKPQDNAPSQTAAKSKPVRGQRRIAFTFRLDPERHLNLRVVSIFRRTSAQKVLEEALDRYLEVAMAEDPSSQRPLAV